MNAFRRRGFRTFLYEYPGYGGRLGLPGENAIVPDARAVIRVLAQRGFTPIYAWGESLVRAWPRPCAPIPPCPCRACVLLTPWDTVANVGLYRYPYLPVPLLMTDKYDSISNLEHFQHPICVVRSSDDIIIPPALTLNLFAHLPNPKKLILHQGYGHDNWPSAPELSWWDDALNFIAPRVNCLLRSCRAVYSGNPEVIERIRRVEIGGKAGKFSLNSQRERQIKRTSGMRLILRLRCASLRMTGN